MKLLKHFLGLKQIQKILQSTTGCHFPKNLGFGSRNDSLVVAWVSPCWRVNIEIGTGLSLFMTWFNISPISLMTVPTSRESNFVLVALMLLVANFVHYKWCKKKLENDWNPGTWVLIWEYSPKAIQWIPAQQGLDGLNLYVHPYVLYKNSLSIGRVISTVSLRNSLSMLFPLI